MTKIETLLAAYAEIRGLTVKAVKAELAEQENASHRPTWNEIHTLACAMEAVA